jgi:hypothetical protein
MTTPNNLNRVFTHTYLTILQRDFARVGVKVDGKPINLRAGHDAWTTNVGRDHWEFHGPENFYWHGRADNANDARAKGWNAWLKKERPAEFEKLDALGNANPFLLALLDQCVKIRRDDVRDQVRAVIDTAAKHADDNVLFTDDRDEDDPEDDGGWLVDFRGTLSYESGNASAAVGRWFQRHRSLAVISPICVSLLARCAEIKNAKLRDQIRAVINVAVENADEYDEPEDGGWDDAFRGTIENRCEDDVPKPVREWFVRHMGL